MNYTKDRHLQPKLKVIHRVVFMIVININFIVLSCSNTTKEDYFTLGKKCDTQGKYKEAIEAYTKVIGLDSTCSEAYSNRGLGYHNIRQYEKAIEDFNKCLQLESHQQSDIAPVYFYRGNSFKEMGRNIEAISSYTDAIEIDPNFTYAYQARGECLQKIKEYERAIEDFTEVIRTKPRSSKAYENRSKTYSAIGETIRAKADAQKASFLFRQINVYGEVMRGEYLLNGQSSEYYQFYIAIHNFGSQDIVIDSVIVFVTTPLSNGAFSNGMTKHIYTSEHINDPDWKIASQKMDSLSIDTKGMTSSILMHNEREERKGKQVVMIYIAIYYNTQEKKVDNHFIAYVLRELSQLTLSPGHSQNADKEKGIRGDKLMFLPTYLRFN